MDCRVKPGDDGLEKAPAHDANEFSATPPYQPRDRSLAQNEGWQILAKLLADRVQQWRRCRVPRCRRARKCTGGRNACFVREFEAVDEVMQRHLLPHIKRQAGLAEP